MSLSLLFFFFDLPLFSVVISILLGKTDGVDTVGGEGFMRNPNLLRRFLDWGSQR